MTTTTPAVSWTTAHDYEDIRYEHSGTGIAKVTIARPEVRNAFRPQTVREMIDAFARIRDDATNVERCSPEKGGIVHERNRSLTHRTVERAIDDRLVTRRRRNCLSLILGNLCSGQ